jgi:Bacterial PH domain
LTAAPDGTVFRSGADRRGLALAVVYVVAAPALAAGALGLAPVVRWGLAATCALVAVATAASLLRRSARTQVTADGLVLRAPLRRPDRYGWEDITAFDAVDPHTDPDAAARLGRRVRMRLRGGRAVLLPGVAGPDADSAAAALSARLGQARERGRPDAGPTP